MSCRFVIHKFEVSLKKIGGETKKFMHLQIWWSHLYLSWGHQMDIVISIAKTYRFVSPTLKQIKCCFFGRRLAVKILKPLDYFLFINTQKQSPSAGFELAIFRLRLAWNTSSLLTAPLTPQKTSGSVATRGLAIHAFCALFEENRFRNKELTLFLCAKTSKIESFSILYGPLDPNSKIELRDYTQFCSTQLLRGH